MNADFETWAMRVLVVSMAAVLARVGAARWRTQDEREEAFREALEGHRRATEASLKDFRIESKEDLERLRSSNETALQTLNMTMAEVAKTAGEIRARMAERYATKEELAALEKRMTERIALCQESCPTSCKS